MARTVTRFLIPVVVLIILAQWQAALAQVTGTLSGVVVAERENPDGGVSLLFGSGTAPGAQADTVRIKLPGDIKSSTPGSLPPNWTGSLTERTWIFHGPVTAVPLYIRLDYPKGSIERIDFEVLLGGQKIGAGSKVPVQKQPAPTVLTDPEGILQLPPELYPGQRLDLQVLDPTKLPPGGVWNFGDRSVPWAPDSNTIRLIVPSGQPLRIAYIDPWGVQLFNWQTNLGEIPDLRLLHGGKSDPARLLATMPRVFPGNQICVRGRFPSSSFNGVLLDGKPLGAPVTASDTVLWFQMPPGTSPGPHYFTGDPAAGFPTSDKLETVVLVVGGSLDQTKLFRGESTQMKLWIEGSTNPIGLRVKNKTPEIINIEGGEDQVLTTSGGKPNAVERAVRGIMRGNFDIQYSLDGVACPPAEDILSEIEEGQEDILSEIDPMMGTRTRTNIAGGETPKEVPKPPDSKPPDRKREEPPEFCGPNVTAALIEAVKRVHERTQSLGIDERGLSGAVRFSERNHLMRTGKRMRSSPTASCPMGENLTCAKTVTIGQSCVLEAHLDSIPYYVQQYILNPDYHSSLHDIMFYAQLGFALAQRLNNGLPLTSDDLTAMTIFSLDEAPEYDSAPFRSCKPCPEQGTLINDWTTEPWSLANGKVVEWKPK